MEQKIKEDKIIWPEDFPDKKLSTPRIKPTLKMQNGIGNLSQHG